MDTYFLRYENRRPPAPIPYSVSRELLWQFLATVNLGIGAWYIAWRFTSSLNPEALWFAIPLVLAEACAYFGLVLFTFNLWQTRDTPPKPPPASIKECCDDPDTPDRPLKVDLFLPTYDEDPELVRRSVVAAKQLRYPHPIDLLIYVLDDGRRESMRAMAESEGVSYISRDNNVGFKAGNLRNAMERTSGDFIVICDADTRVFPTFIDHTLGYFRDPDVAWVQTPQWFFDLPEGEALEDVLVRFAGAPGRVAARALEAVCGPVRLGEDPFANDPQFFYDVILRRRNAANASFCCGAGSIHRREAVMRVALRNFADSVEARAERAKREIEDDGLRNYVSPGLDKLAALETELTPYRFHVSEDIYTSIYLHSDPDRDWKSVLHPTVESKMLSPQDLQSWTVQRFKYAGGTLDIALHDNPLFRPGLSWRQRAMYLMTFWSYLGVLWNIVFLASPLVYLFTAIAPVAAYSQEFFLHLLPFLIVNELAFMVGTWGISGYKGKVTYLAFFSVNLRALITVLRGQKIKFPTTPKDRQEGDFFHLVVPQAAVMILTALGITFATTMHLLGLGSYQTTGIIVNSFWGVVNSLAMWRLVAAAFWKPRTQERPEKSPEGRIKEAVV